MNKILVYILLSLSFTVQIALADAPVIWSGTTAKWLPNGLRSAGICKLDAQGVMTSGQASLTSNVSGILPLSNGGTNKNMTAVSGGLLYTDSDSVEVSTAGTAGRAVLSGGTGAPTYFNPTVGSVIFGGASGALAEDNAYLFWDSTNHRLGLGTATPSGNLDLTNTGDTLTGNLVLWGQGRSANSEWLLYDSPIGELTFYNPAQGVYGFGMKATGGMAAGPTGFPSDVNFGVKNNAGETTKNSIGIQKMASQTGDFIRMRDTDGSTVLAKIAIDGSATFNGVTSDLTGNASTATALAANPSDCSANQFANAIVASGNLTCAQPSASNLSNGVTGSGNVVLATNPTITNPTVAKIANLTTNGLLYATGSDGTLNTSPLTGDVTTSGAAATLATVNSNVGSFTNANITVNAKGLITAASSGSGGGASATWSGYFTDTVGASAYWTRASTSYGDFTFQGTSGNKSLVETLNDGFGTVTAQTSNGAGITFTAPSTGKVCVGASVFSGDVGTSQQSSFRTTDGSGNVIAVSAAISHFSGSTFAGSVPTGCFAVTASSSYTVKVQAKNSGSTTGLCANNVANMPCLTFSMFYQ